MKRGRDEEKMMEPMFPRLHVNDTEKGGPRAPPRNKMALYEQLSSIPSQRSNRSAMTNNSTVNSAPSVIQGNGNERGTLFSRQLPTRHQPDSRSSHYNDFNSPSQIEQREKLDDDEDDFTVPTFTSSFPSQECGEYANDTDARKLVPPNPSYFGQSLKSQKAAEMSRPKSSMWQEGNNQKHEDPKEFVAGRVKAALDSSINETSAYLQKKADPSPCHEQGVIPSNMIDRLNADDISRSEPCTESQATSNRHNIAVSRENITETDKRTPNSLRSLSSEDQNIVHDPSNVTESYEDRSYGSVHARNLDRADSVSETSVLDSITGQDAITPDDVVDLIGQKHFWKARRAIANQQRIFAVQVFELHKLIKVQRLIAASPNLLLDDSAYLSKPIKTLPTKKLPSEKRHSDKPGHNKEGSVESAVGDTLFPSVRNGVPPLNKQTLSGNSPAPFINSDHYPGPLCFNQQNSQQWLIPVMSPSEGLVYKPYSGSGFMGPGYGGNGMPAPIPLTGNFFNPGYAFPVPPHGYFPPYGMPVMNAAAFPGSFVEKTNPPPMPVLFSANSASGPSEKMSGTSARSAVKGRSGLRVETSGPEVPTQVIKVVPRNARSATESAARIFQSIQEERKQYDLA